MRREGRRTEGEGRLWPCEQGAGGGSSVESKMEEDATEQKGTWLYCLQQSVQKEIFLKERYTTEFLVEGQVSRASKNGEKYLLSYSWYAHIAISPKLKEKRDSTPWLPQELNTRPLLQRD